MGENIWKWSNWQGINLQNIQTVHAAQYKKNHQIKKWAEDWKTFLQKTYRWLRGTWKRYSTSLVIREMQIKTTWGITSQSSECFCCSDTNVVVCMQVGKEFPVMRQNERRIKFIRVGGAVRTVGWLKGELNALTGLQLFFTASKQKIPTWRVALGDWLGCYRVDSRVVFYIIWGSKNWPV